MDKPTSRVLALLGEKLQSKLAEDEKNWLKPKWMRWRTFQRICEKLASADEAWGKEAFAPFAPF